ncbi:MAG TPA: LLM class flavin-dependent oxidoreductase [Actinophytocola sp.]|jgi:alkanesulfonate monooxygenase SsuD/methylene tetrahydromethanopterin reductase-like flavin-dependent oxidoreductase (luciferase family)|nr:LLM class flavin-dependent oxidoreductase [Actinophytocola sp.]
MPPLGKPLRRLGFLTIGLFDEDDPRRGHESTLEIIQLGERLGFDSAWVRHRHLQYGISSPVAVLAAASQRTSRIELGTAVIPLGWENPLRLAEDLATVDILSGGRLNPGVSVGPPMRWDHVKSALYPGTGDVEDFSHDRVRRLLDLVRGEPATDGTASLRSAQLSHVRAFRAHHPDGDRARVSQGLVVIPTDSATPGQRARYEEYARSRLPRTASPQGPARMMFAPDLVGTSADIAERLHDLGPFREIDEVAFALPFTFAHDDYVQILTDIATKLGPALGWQWARTAGTHTPPASGA